MNEDRKAEIIRWFGECIFPQQSKLVLDRFGEEIFSLVAEGYISTSRSKGGIHPTMMKEVKGYVELTNKGWEFYTTLKTLTP